MSKIVTLILICLTFSTMAGVKSDFIFSSLAAEKYAQGALIEYFGNENISAVVNTTPIIVSGIDGGGRQIIMVLYPDNAGCYFVSLTLNKDGLLVVDSRGTSMQTADELVALFSKGPFIIGE